MAYFAWTIEHPGRQDIRKVTTIEELHDFLRVLDLPGVAPPEIITIDAEVSDHGTYTYNEGTMYEWKLTWTKIDCKTEVLD